MNDITKEMLDEMQGSDSIIGKILREKRLAEKLSEQDVARFLGWSVDEYKLLESGRTSIAITTLCQLLPVMNLNVDDFYKSWQEGLKAISMEEELIAFFRKISSEDDKKRIISAAELLSEGQIEEKHNSVLLSKCDGEIL
nr:helix-turn-helix domain-containing protein [Cytophagales bacterium]